MKFGTGPTLEEALEAILRVALRAGGLFAREWIRELRLIADKLDERSQWGPKGVVWRGEARRIALAADVAEYGLGRREALASAQSLMARLPALEGKAITAADQLEITAIRLDLEAAVGEAAEQVRLDPRGHRVTGKAMSGMDAKTERRFCSFLEALGGGPADGRGTLGAEALLCDERTFERGGQLWFGEAEPADDTERVALARWRP